MAGWIAESFERVPRVVGTDGEFETVTFIAGTPGKGSEHWPAPPVVACQRDGTTSLPRAWDRLEVSVSIVGLVVGVNVGALVVPVSLPVGGAFDDEGVCA
jgi:hypothetical protein